MSRIGKRITAVTLTFALTVASVCGGVRIHGVTPEVKEAQAAGSTGKYVKDIMISYASTKEKAEQELGSDYIVLDRNFNEGMSGNSWIGYSTTDDEDEAITDIKAMPMDGKYSTSDYEVLLKNQKKVIETQLDAVIPSIVEFAKNYDAGLNTAKAIYKLLNFYHEDDSDKNMGDFLLEKGRALAKNRKDSKSISDLEKIYMEGNNSVVSTIESLLLKAADTQLKGKGSWITRMSVLGPNGLYEIYKQTVGGNKRAVERALDADFSDIAADLLEGMKAVREKLKEGENSDIAKAIDDEDKLNSIESDLLGDDIEEVPLDSDTGELIETMCKEAENGAEAAGSTMDMAAFSVSTLLKESPYGKGKTLYDLFMDENLTKKDLYPMAYLLSNGQKSIIETMGVYPLFEGALSEYSEMDSELLDEVDIDENVYSVYEGVDRSVFDGDTAITADTLKNMETRQFHDYLVPVELSSLNYKMLVACGIILAAIATGYAVYTFIPETKTMVCPGFPMEETQKLVAMENNLKMINTYDLAWKVQYLEEKGYISSGSLGRASKAKNVAEELRTLFNDTISEMETQGRTATNLAREVERFGSVEKANYVAKYGTAIEKQALKAEVAGAERICKLPRAGWTTRIAASLGAIAAIAFAAYEIYCMTHHDKINFAHIPANMVCRTYEGDVNYLAYHAVTTKSGKSADIHDKKGIGWQVLYTTGDDRMGDPILASSLWITEGNASSDQDMVPVSYFDESGPADLADDEYTGAETDRASMFFKRGTEPIEEVADAEEEEEEVEDEVAPDETETPEEEAEADAEEPSAEGSVFGGAGMIWIILIVVVVAGGAAGLGVYFRKRRKS